jgi:hypothetical protein
MITVDTTLSLDFNRNRSLQTVYCAQGDKLGRFIEIKLYDNGERVTLAASDTATVNASTNGIITVTEQSCNITNNTIYVQITEAMTVIPGISHCVVKVAGSSNEVIHTARFDLDVEPNPANEDMPSIVETATIFSRLAALEAASATHVSSNDVTNIVKLTQAQYDALTIKNATTLYIIVENQA